MDASAVRHGVSWGWRALLLLAASMMILGGWSSGASVGAWIAVGLGVVIGITSLWSDASVAVHVDARGIWPVDPRRPPMEWRSMHEIVQRSNSVEVRDEAGRTLSLSSVLRGEEELVRRAFQHAVENQRRVARLPSRVRAEDRAPAILFAGLAVVLFVFGGVLVAREGSGVALLVALLSPLAALSAVWLWRRRITDTCIDAQGVTITTGTRRRHVAHGALVDLVATQHGQYSLQVWDGEARPVVVFGSSQGLARTCAHLLAASPYELPVMPPIEVREPKRESAERRAVALVWVRWWIAPSLLGCAAVLLVAPEAPVASEAPWFPSGWLVVLALSVASTLASVRRVRRRVPLRAAALGLLAGVVGFLSGVVLPAEPGTLTGAVVTTSVEGSLLLAAAVWLSRGSKAPDELASDLLQLGAAFGGVALLGYLPQSNPLWCTLLVLPLLCGAMVSAPWIVWVHAKTQSQGRWRAAAVAVGVLSVAVLHRVELDDPQWRALAELAALGAALAVAHERERRALLVPREAGAPMRELFLALTLGMIAALVYTASRTDASRVLFLVAVSPLVSGAMLVWIGMRMGTHEVLASPTQDRAALSPSDESQRVD